MKIRKITSLTALISFILLVLTSIILYIVPPGRVAYWSDWHLWGLSKTEWGNLHINLGFLFLVTICLHIYYNWKPILNYMKNKAKKLKVFTGDFNAALIVTLLFVIGTYLMLPPFTWILDLGEHFKDSATMKYGEPPYGHAELSSIKSFATKTGLDLEESLKRLEDSNIIFKNHDQVLLEIAKDNKISPKDIYAIIKPEADKSERPMLPAIPPPGMGKKPLQALCDQFHIDHKKIIKGLSEKGIVADIHSSIKDIADKNGKTSMEIYDRVREISLKET